MKKNCDRKIDGAAGKKDKNDFWGDIEIVEMSWSQGCGVLELDGSRLGNALAPDQKLLF